MPEARCPDRNNACDGSDLLHGDWCQARSAASVYHVRKEDLREGSALDVDPPFPAFDVVHRQAYERLAEEVERLRELLARFENESPKHIRRRIFDGR